MFSARGSVGASTKAQLGPVLSCGGCWPCRKNGWQQASLPAHAHPTRWEDKEGVEASLGWRERLLGPPGAPHPERVSLLLLEDGGSTSLYPLEQSSGVSRFRGYPLWLLLNCSHPVAAWFVSISAAVLPQALGGLLPRGFLSHFQVVDMPRFLSAVSSTICLSS